MIDPIVTVTLVVAFVLTVAAVLLTRRATERPRDDAAEHSGEKTEQRYLNGGWH